LLSDPLRIGKRLEPEAIKRLSAFDVRPAIADIDVEAARRTASEIGGAAVAVEADVRERASVERAFGEASPAASI
jgi:hypothetical protein